MLTALVVGCSSVPEAPAPSTAAEPAPAAATAPEPKLSADSPVIVAFGDSLTAGYGLAPDESYPYQLQQELARRGLEYRVVNEGVSGDTTAAALARIGGALAHQPDWVLLALGANDGLRGLPIEAMEANLRNMVEQFQAAGAKVVLAGMTLPRNYGPDYVTSFEAVYPRVAKDYDLPLIPFLLEGVAAEPDLNLDDGIHPNAAGAKLVADGVADFLEPLLKS